jgi:hypothetical protein
MTMQPDPVFAHFTKTRTMIVDAASGDARSVRRGWRLDTDVVDTPNGTPHHPTPYDGGFALAPGGKSVALSVPRHGTIYLQHDLEIWSPDGEQALSGRPLDRNPHWFDFAPDGSLFVASADGVRDVLWRLTPPQDVYHVPADMVASRIDLGDVDFGPDASIARNGRSTPRPRRPPRASSRTRTRSSPTTRSHAASASTGRATTAGRSTAC